MEQGAVMIEAKGLSKYYGPFVAVRDISFAIPAGRSVSALLSRGYDARQEACMSRRHPVIRGSIASSCVRGSNRI